MKKLVGYKKEFSLKLLKERGVDEIMVNSTSFSSFDSKLDLSLLKRQCDELGMSVWVKLDCLYEENELESLNEYLAYLDGIKVYGVMFTDIAVNELAIENGYGFKKMYTPETLLTNSYDVSLLTEEMDYAVISQDITFDDIRTIIDDNPGKCYLRVHGPILLTYSKRHFISAYLKQDRDVYDDGYYVIEETRDNKMALVQSERGCWLYGNILQSLHQIESLKESALAGIIIDNVLYDEQYNLFVLDLYNDVAERKISGQQAVGKLHEYNSEMQYTDLKDVQESWLNKED